MMVVENLRERERERCLGVKKRNERREERGEGVSFFNF
jgi:hypothetical protein